MINNSLLFFQKHHRRFLLFPMCIQHRMQLQLGTRTQDGRQLRRFVFFLSELSRPPCLLSELLNPWNRCVGGHPWGCYLVVPSRVAPRPPDRSDGRGLPLVCDQVIWTCGHEYDEQGQSYTWPFCSLGGLFPPRIGRASSTRLFTPFIIFTIGFKVHVSRACDRIDQTAVWHSLSWMVSDKCDKFRTCHSFHTWQGPWRYFL